MIRVFSVCYLKLVKAFRVYDSIENWVIVSKDVKFDKDKDWNWARTIDEKKLDMLDQGESKEVQYDSSESEEVEEDYADDVIHLNQMPHLMCLYKMKEAIEDHLVGCGIM